MMKIYLSVIYTFFCIAYLTAQQNNSPYTELVWFDEFNGEGIPDPDKWGYEVGYIRNGELQYHTEARVENAFQKDGYLHLKAIYDDTIKGADGTILNYKEGHITSASIISKDKGDWRYGRFEIRAKVPGPNKGSWPAIWMMPTESGYGNWPNSGEIDIMEHVGYYPEYVYFTSHTGNYNANKGTLQSNEYLYKIYDDFHVFILEWYEDRLEWYIDDKKMPVHEFYKTSQNSGDWPFRRIFYMMLTMTYGGSWGGKTGVDVSQLPLEFLVDYVRVYQAPPVSVNEPDNDRLTVYPNPAKEVLHISGAQQGNEICIFSLSGQRLMQCNNAASVNVSSLAKGCYLMKLTDNAGNTVTQKFIKE